MECSEIKNFQEKNNIPQVVPCNDKFRNNLTLRNFFYLMAQLLVGPRG